MTAVASAKTYETTALQYVYQFHNTMVDMDLMLAYQGDVSQLLTKAFSSMAEEKLSKQHEDERVKRKVFHVMVESLQNLSKHTDSLQTGTPIKPGTGIFMLGRQERCYSIVTGNAVANNRMDDLRKKLDHINGLDAAELKEFDKTTLRSSRLSEKAGAGLGLIDMARKTGSKVEFQFIPLNEHTSLFIYRLCIPRTP